MKIEINKQRILTACKSAILDNQIMESSHRSHDGEEHRVGGLVVDHEKYANHYVMLAGLCSSVAGKIESGGELTEEEFNLIKEYL